jgi:hypothetical protein
VTRLTYDEARAEVLETTELGYTLASQDKLWTCFIFDTWSTDEMRGNRLYFRNGDRVLSYDMWDDELVWTSRAEAETFQAEQQARYDNEATTGREPVIVYLINWGDDARWERSILEERVGITEGKFAGSKAALEAMTDNWNRLSSLAPIPEEPVEPEALVLDGSELSLSSVTNHDHLHEDAEPVVTVTTEVLDDTAWAAS